MQHNITQDQLNETIKLMGGLEPQAPIGMCFTAALDALSVLQDKALNGEASDVKLVHGIGTANMPGQEGRTIAHAWIEFNHKQSDQRMVMEPIWCIVTTAKNLRESLKVSYSVEYSLEDLKTLMFKDGRFDTGPWDEKINALAEGVKQC